jgi:hypothetical protein
VSQERHSPIEPREQYFREHLRIEMETAEKLDQIRSYLSVLLLLVVLSNVGMFVWLAVTLFQR